MQLNKMTKDYALSLFEYKEGNLYWKVQKAPHVKVGSKVGSPAHGYETVYVDGKNWRIHRLVFLMHFDYLPSTIDHINGIRNDNRIENLRAVDNYQNAQNSKLRSTSKSGIKGVSWNTNRQKWCVRINTNKKLKQWYVEDLELAELIAIEARDKFHGVFANHGTFKGVV